MAHVTPTDERRALLERMVAEQPGRLARKMRAAGHEGLDAEDLAQETLVRAIRSLEGLRGPADEALLRGWVDRIAVNLSRKQPAEPSRASRMAGHYPRMPSVARSTRTALTSWRVADRSAASLPIFLMSNASTPWRASLRTPRCAGRR
jgi:DNA-directed RNA polymerase specialized sigma24 family protein